MKISQPVSVLSDDGKRLLGFQLDSNHPELIQYVPTYSLDSNSNVTGLVGPGGVLVPGLSQTGYRPRFLCFGNSISSQSCVAMSSSTTTVSGVHKAGATSITVASIGSIVNGSKLAFSCYDTSIFTTTVSGSPVGNVFTISSPLPKMVRSGDLVQLYTTPMPTNIRRSNGPIYSALSMMGMPVDILNGYGYGGGQAEEMVLDLQNKLQSLRPQYVHLFIPENSIPNNSTAATLINVARTLVSTCISYGAIPFMNTAIPSTSYTAGSQVAVYDAFNLWVTSSMQSEFPYAIPCDVGKQWLDTNQPTLRTPLAGWTDGVHPNASKWQTIAQYYKSIFQRYLPASPSTLNYSVNVNPSVSGTGGTTSGTGGSVAGIVPASSNLAVWGTAVTAPTVATTSRNADGSYKIVMTMTSGTAGESVNQAILSQTYTLPNSGNVAGVVGQGLIGRCKVKCNTMNGASQVSVRISFSTGETYAVAAITGWASDPNIIGQTMVLETQPIQIPVGATTADVSVSLSTQLQEQHLAVF